MEWCVSNDILNKNFLKYNYIIIKEARAYIYIHLHTSDGKFVYLMVLTKKHCLQTDIATDKILCQL